MAIRVIRASVGLGHWRGPAPCARRRPRMTGARSSRAGRKRFRMVLAVPLDPRTPVLIGSGQFQHHADRLEDALDPATLMARSIELAAADAGLPSVPAPDSIRVVNELTWKYGDPGLIVAQILGLSPRETSLSANGGNSAQSLVNPTAQEILAGDIDIAFLTGGEAWRSRGK